MKDIYAGIEAGGTKFVCVAGAGPEDIVAATRFPTGGPKQTIERAIEFFRAVGPVKSAGIGSFGPLDLNPASPTYGRITTTPKPGWSNTDIAGRIGGALGVKVGFDTDVNAAALGESRWGAARELTDFIYLTVGTGIGGGGMVGGQLVHGLVHPEMGHLCLPHDWQTDPYPGRCPYHGDCLEGLAAGPALEERWGQSAEALPDEHPAWELEAQYLALALVNFICTMSPQRIIMGGGVMSRHHLFPLIRAKVQELLNDYVQAPAILKDIDTYIVPPGLGGRAGVLGAIALAQQANE